jgi:dihydrofolate reductase
VKVRATTHISVTPETGCTNGCSPLSGQPGGSGGVDDVFARQHDPGIGAEIMGAGKFGHPGWHEDPNWQGAWGPNPPFHTPVFVLTHHHRPSIEMEGGTTFHFIDASPTEALETAREAADDQDVRIGGGPTIIRDFLAAGLVDYMHTVVVPIRRTRRPRAGLQSRSHLLTDRSHPCDIHPHGNLNRPGRYPGARRGGRPRTE